MSNSYRHIFKYTGLFGSVQALYVLLAVVRNKLTALFIGAAGMGLADLYVRATDLVANLTNFGLGMSAVRRLSELYAESGNTRQLSHHVRLVRTWVLATALLGMFLFLLASPLISWMAHGTLNRLAEFCWLAPTVLFLTLMGGEMAILKGVRQLRKLAKASVANAVGTLVIAASLYYLFALKGVIPVILTTTALGFFLYLHAASQTYSYRVGPFRLRFLKNGMPMVKLGTAYILAGAMTSGAELLVRTGILRMAGGFEKVGLYSAGLTLTVSYARMIFVAMDADYFPRLSAAVGNVREMNVLINRQINTLVVLMAPFLVVFCLSLPLIVRILYTVEFLEVIPMVLCAACYMYFKAIYTPVAYISLSKGDSVIYMTLEIVYDVVFCLLVIGGFAWKGLVGAGLALSAANLFDLTLILTFCSRHYGYRMNRSTLRRCVVLFFFLLFGLFVSMQSSVILRAVLGIAVVLMLFPFIWPVLKKIKK